MKRAIFLLFIFFLAATANGQLRNPASTAELAAAINNRYTDSVAKIQAAYSWVTLNMRYDKKGVFALNNSPDPRAVIDIAFAKRSGVCENFAAIFTDICSLMGFTAVSIEGYANHPGDRNDEGHSWAAVYVDNDWFLFDPTWDIGKSAGFKFFKKPGREFLESHMPFDPLWQLVPYPKTKSRNNSGYESYKDSVFAYLSSDSLTRLEAATKRIAENKKMKPVEDLHLKVLKNNLEIKRQEEQMEWYELAVGKLNAVTDLLNTFIDIRNENNISTKEYQKMNTILSDIDTHLETALTYLDKVDQSKATMVFGTWPAREQAERLKDKSRDQREYLNKILASNQN